MKDSSRNITILYLLAFFLTSVASQLFQPSPQSSQKCEPVTIPICSDIPYNMTMMPNLLNHATQEDAALAMAQFNPLIRVECSQDIKLFLCTLHVPLCTPVLNQIIEPCRHLCISARRGCESLMLKFGFRWPQHMECSRFPETFCVGENKTMNGVKMDELECPTSMRAPFKSNYVLETTSGRLSDCSLSCDSDDVHPMIMNSRERSVLRIWTASWAAVSFISSIFTIFTFLIDLPRFNYPVRPIVYMAVCYVGIAVIYLIGTSNGNNYSCSSTDNTLLVTQRLSNIKCTLMALFFYMCINASAAWWLVLCVSWFLAARLQWSNEAISSLWMYFHSFGWGFPTLLSLLLLISESIDGDIMSGICSVGNLDGRSLVLLVVIPQGLAILIGLIFLMCGVSSMLRIRSYYKVREALDYDVSKLEKLMLRVSLFALLYTLPNAIGIGINVYQSIHSSHWITSSYTERCHSTRRLLYGFLSPIESCPSINLSSQSPDIILFATKYICHLIVGITCAVWVMSMKTIASYQNIYAKMFGRQSNPLINN